MRHARRLAALLAAVLLVLVTLAAATPATASATDRTTTSIVFYPGGCFTVPETPWYTVCLRRTYPRVEPVWPTRKHGCYHASWRMRRPIPGCPIPARYLAGAGLRAR